MTKFRTYAPGQLLLMPPNLNEWIAEDHLAHFISDTIDVLDLSEIYDDYVHETDRGNLAYHPAMMLKILIYGYCVGTMSSRKIEKACWDNVAFRVLSANQHPDFQSIARFRRRHLKALPGLFKQVLRLAQEAGLVKLGLIALDGTKIKANASKHKAMSYERLVENEARLQKEIAELLSRAQAADNEDDTRYGSDKRGDDLPAELARRESRLAAIQKAKEVLEAEAKVIYEVQKKADLKKQKEKEERYKLSKRRGGRAPKERSEEPRPEAQRNFTDPESRIMWSSSSKSFEQAYNAQAAVDAEAQIIVVASLTQEVNDKQQLLPMIKKIRQNCAIDKVTVLADCGYFSDKNITDELLEGIDVLIPPDRQAHGKPVSKTPKGRIPKHLTAAQRMARKLQTAKGKDLYKRRKAIVEPVFGQIKHAGGFRQFLLRSFEKVSHEWELICLTHNIKKLFTRGWQPCTN